jgi:hypothetical protein
MQLAAILAAEVVGYCRARGQDEASHRCEKVPM